MGKAGELDNYLDSLPPKPKARWPELRLRADMPSLLVEDTTRAEIVHELTQEHVGALALTDQTGAITAVAVSPEHYLELVTGALSQDETKQSAHLDRRIGPTDAALAADHVEQVDPHATWFPAGPLG
jgi:hypothetical protein